MHTPSHVRTGRIQIPIAAIIEAAIEAADAARESGADNHDADSPGGATVTAGEIAEDVGVFVTAFGAALLPRLAR